MQRNHKLLLFSRNSAPTASAKRKHRSHLLVRRPSAPASSAKGEVLASLADPTFSTERITFDRDLTHDAATMEIFRHPVGTSDGRIHEASSLLRYMGIGGRSPYTRDIFTAAVYLLPLKNDLDARFGNHRNRQADYDITPVMQAIQNWIILYNDKDDPIDLKAQHIYLPDDSEEEVAPTQVVQNPVVAANPATLFTEDKSNFKRGIYTFLGTEALGLFAAFLVCLYARNDLSDKEVVELAQSLSVMSTLVGVIAAIFVAVPEVGYGRGPMR